MNEALKKIKEQLKHIAPEDLSKAEKNILSIIEENTNTKDLEELLEEWSVMQPGQWENKTGPKDWFAVSNDDGIVAYFGKEGDAFGFRMYRINQILNG